MIIDPYKGHTTTVGGDNITVDPEVTGVHGGLSNKIGGLGNKIEGLGNKIGGLGSKGVPLNKGGHRSTTVQIAARATVVEATAGEYATHANNRVILLGTVNLTPKRA